MTYVRARIRSLTVISTTGAFLASAMVGCSVITPEDDRRSLERSGFSDVKIVRTAGYQTFYEAMLNGCKLSLFITADKELWNATVLETADGRQITETNPPGDAMFEPAGDAEELKKDQRFLGYCPSR